MSSTPGYARETASSKKRNKSIRPDNSMNLIGTNGTASTGLTDHAHEQKRCNNFNDTVASTLSMPGII